MILSKNTDKGMPEKIYFIEVKNNTGRLTKGQKRSGVFNCCENYYEKLRN